MDVGVMVSSYNHGDWDRLMNNEFDRPPAKPDVDCIDEVIAIGEMVEPLGFDSIWTTEHYGSAYSMQPNPLQWLAYWAGRTTRVDLGSAVVVVPWWNPIRLAHELAMLDILLRGRRLHIGFGRGVSEHEYASLGVPRATARERFHETIDILKLADSTERFTYDGEIYQIPPTSIRPQPRHKGRLLDGARAAFATKKSAELAARAGLGQLFVTGEPLAEMAKQVEQFNAIRAEQGLEPDHGIAVLFMYCAPTEVEAERGYQYFKAQGEASQKHYFKWNNTGFEGVPGYEDYVEKKVDGKVAKDRKSDVSSQEASQLIGTPQQIIAKLKEVQAALSLNSIVLHVQYGGMPHELARASLELFSSEVLPTVHAMAPESAAQRVEVTAGVQ